MRTPLLVLALLLVASDAEAQRRRRCNGDEIPTKLLEAGPIYRDCDVDRVARVRPPEPELTLDISRPSLREGCFASEFQFEVDSTGMVVIATVELRRSNLPDLETAMRQTFATLRFEPAIKEGRPVRQWTVYRRALGIARAADRGFSSAPPPRCS